MFTSLLTQLVEFLKAVLGELTIHHLAALVVLVLLAFIPSVAKLVGRKRTRVNVEVRHADGELFTLDSLEFYRITCHNGRGPVCRVRLGIVRGSRRHFSPGAHLKFRISRGTAVASYAVV